MTYPLPTFLAFLYTALFLLLGVSILRNKKTYEELINEFTKSAALLSLSGLFAFILGLYTILYNEQGYLPTFSSWIFVELFGWLVLLKGIFRTLFPVYAQRMMKTHSRKLLPLAGWGAIIIGILMLFLMFFVG